MGAFAQDPNFHIYLGFGQSNMDGAGAIEDQDKQGVSPRFKNLSSVTCTGRTVGQWLPATPPLGRCTASLSMVDYFGRTMVEKLPENITIGVSIVAVAGSKIELFDKTTYKAYADTAPSWMKGWIAEFGGYPYGRLVEMGKKAQEVGVIKGILMHQGESNNGEGDKWLPKVKRIYDDLMKDLSLDPTKVPLIAGELAGKAEGGTCWFHNETIQKLNTVIPNTQVVSSSGLAQKGDGFHFTSAAYRTFGARYAEAMLKVLDATPVIPVPAHRDTVHNGTFQLATAGWKLNVWGGAATGSVVNGEYKLDVTQAGTQKYQIQLTQAGLILVQGKSYQVSFDAYAQAPRNLEFNFEQDVSPYTSYLAAVQQYDLTTTKQTIVHRFTMTQPTDSNSRISFNAGGEAGAVFLDNIKLEAYDGALQIAQNSKKQPYSIHQNQNVLTIRGIEESQEGVLVTLQNVQGKKVLSQQLQGASTQFDLSGVGSGLYVLQIHDGSRRLFSKTLNIQ